MRTVLVLSGGPDAERAVSLDSGAAVAGALRRAGSWRVVAEVIDRPDGSALRHLLGAAGADVVFPVLHGSWGEGGGLQRLLEALPVAYVGADPDAAALAMDKLATKRLVAEAGVATPAAELLAPGQARRLPPPLVLKPVDDGSSVDLRICLDDAAVEAARAVLHPRRGPLLAETYIAGRELTVALVGATVLPLIEIIPAAPFYDYDAKYHRDDTRYVVDPPLPDGVEATCRRAAGIAFDRTGTRDLARVDFMLDERGPWLLEINTMPGFTEHSLVPMAARAAGMEMPALCSSLAEMAMARATAPAPGPPFSGV